jgi:hypothetical protein
MFSIGLLVVGSTALGYYYYYVYEPPLATAERFMNAMENKDAATLKHLVVVTPDRDSTKTRFATDEEIRNLLAKPFHRGQILEQDKREGASGAYDFLVYRHTDGFIFALLLMRQGDGLKVVIPETPRDPNLPYLWDYTWTN